MKLLIVLLLNFSAVLTKVIRLQSDSVIEKYIRLIFLRARARRNMPKMVKIMITGYPSLENAVEALNKGADAYIIKPFKPQNLLALIKEKLEEQSQAEKMTEEKVTEWIKTRARKLEDDSQK